MARFASATPTGTAVQELEGLVRTALFKPAAALVGGLLQGAADRVDAQYQPQPGEERKGRESLQVQCLFGTFTLQRDYYYHPGKNPALTRPMPLWDWRGAIRPVWRA